MRKKVQYVNNGMINVPDIELEYKGYFIKPKLDMGNTPWQINGNTYKRGYVVTDGMCNIMPGATWFSSVIEAKAGIDAFIDAWQDGEIFWKRLREKQGLEEFEDV